MRDDYMLDAMRYAMLPKEPRHLRGWRKVWSWIRSRPLTRVRKNLALEKKIRERLRRGVYTPETVEMFRAIDRITASLAKDEIRKITRPPGEVAQFIPERGHFWDERNNRWVVNHDVRSEVGHEQGDE